MRRCRKALRYARRLTVPVLVDTIEDDRVKVQVQIEGVAEALDEG
jgi:hypothetical protein